jgi:hypothetical protein
VSNRGRISRSQEHREIAGCCHHKSPWWRILLEWLTFAAAIAAAIAATIYAGISDRIRQEMQVQTCIQR